VVKHLWKFGEILKQKINLVSKELNIDKYFFIEGPSICLNYRTLDKNFKDNLLLRTIFQQEMLKKNIIIPFISPSFSHKKKELDYTVNACKSALLVYKKALFGNTKKYLNGKQIKPVFRKHN